ncbi:MAG: hypothetical protein HZB66_03720 [Candidatus Aenigmarchaeota archaeon]|nr:hypothetical protein [Candidatus Aenigmarchaeota archaeon]
MSEESATSTVKARELTNLESELYSEVTANQSKRTFWQKLNDLYFEPKTFEKSGKLYEALGAKWFGKYCPNGGSYWTQKGQSSMIHGRKKGDLESFIVLTKILEGIHAFGGAPFCTTMAAIYLADKDYASAAIWGVIDIALNFYPVMSQRYNRNKTIQILDRLEEREARKTPATY